MRDLNKFRGNNKKIIFFLLFGAAMTTLFNACGGGGGGSVVPVATDPTPTPDPIPTTPWLVQLGATTGPGDNSGSDQCQGVSVDSSGNVYCAGHTSGALGEASAGSNDAFVMKLNSSGDVQWVTHLGATTGPGDNSGSDGCNGVSVDSSGNVYCAGYTAGALGEASGGSNDAFVMKLNSSGVVQWVTQLGAITGPGDNSGNDQCQGVSVDSSGNVYCAGYTNGALGEANGTGWDAFVMKLNSSGAVQWVTHLGATTGPGDSSGADYCMGVSVDSSGNVYCAGYTNGALGEASAGSFDAFVIKLNSSGAIQWVTQLGATTGPGDNSGSDQCDGVSVDSSGNVYCAGRTNGDLGETNAGNFDAFVIKLNSSGAVQWATQLGATTGPGSSVSDRCQGVSVDSSGNVYCAGSTGGAMGEANGGSFDVFAVKLNSSGDLQWLTQLGATTGPGDSSGLDYGNGASVDSSGNVYCAGSTNGALGEANGGSNDAFVMKLNPSGEIQ